jgi:hypothetical protein
MENVAALAISLIALVVGVLLTVRQIQLARGGNHLPVVLETFKESRSRDWFEAQEYILTKLAQEYPADCGYCGLPAPIRDKVNVIGLFFDDLGKLVAHRVIDERLALGSYGPPIAFMWDALAPYVYEERQAHVPYFWVYFEDLAARMASVNPEVVYAKLGLCRRPPRAVDHSPIPLGDHLNRTRQRAAGHGPVLPSPTSQTHVTAKDP